MKLFIFLSIVVFQSYSWSADPESRSDSYKICIHSYYVSGIGFIDTATSGHGSITIEKNNVRYKSFGFYPNINMFENSQSDGPLSPGDIQWYQNVYQEQYPQMQVNQTKFCRTISEADVERATSLARGYQNRFGEWRLNGNNCVSFAKYIYTAVTHDQLQATADQPRALYNTLSRANDNHVASIQELYQPPTTSQLRQATDTVEATFPITEPAPLER